jgi:uncharacterized membrane protein YeaQ/YmgE (transglycosylase-associated protein family)
MSILELILLLVVAGLIGGLAKSLTGYAFGGCLASIVLGFIGALVGTWLADRLDLPDLFVIRIDDRPFPIIWSVIGAILFVAVLSLLIRRPAPHAR